MGDTRWNAMSIVERTLSKEKDGSEWKKIIPLYICLVCESWNNFLLAINSYRTEKAERKVFLEA